MTMIISGSDGLEFPDGSDQTSAFTGNAATITSGTIATARLATGTANSSTYLRGDQTWAAVPAATPGGSTTQVQYNNAGAFGGDSGFVYSGGNVGIGGATSPSQKLHVLGAMLIGNYGGMQYLYFDSTSAYVGRSSATGDIWLNNGGAQNTIFGVGGTEQASITGAGVFKFNSGYGSSAVAYGCRAWVNFNGTGTPAIRGSGNVSSITDNSQGDFTVNFTNAMPDALYATVAACSTADSQVETVLNINSQTSGAPVSPTTTTTRMVISKSGVGRKDPEFVCVSIFR